MRRRRERDVTRERRITQPSYNNKQGRCTIPNKKARNSKQVKERAIYQY
ncbi:hypothetical protein HMPREF1572_00727 [Gardnerella vaginalis JCP7275]|nr:hypothetical protein HMPREF1572_00727 [Gardnerella vaginalis JCP7275]